MKSIKNPGVVPLSSPILAQVMVLNWMKSILNSLVTIPLKYNLTITSIVLLIMNIFTILDSMLLKVSIPMVSSGMENILLGMWMVEKSTLPTITFQIF